MPCDPLMGPSTYEIVGVESMSSLFGQLREGYGFQSRTQLRHKPLSSKGVSWRVVQCFLSRLFSRCRHRLETLTRPLAAIKTKPDGRFRHHVKIQRVRGVVGIQSMREELRHGLHCEDVRVHQLWVRPPFYLTSFPLLCRNQTFPHPPSSACPR